MQINSDKAIAAAKAAYDKYGSWKAVREACRRQAEACKAK